MRSDLQKQMNDITNGYDNIRRFVDYLDLLSFDNSHVIIITPAVYTQYCAAHIYWVDAKEAEERRIKEKGKEERIEDIVRIGKEDMGLEKKDKIELKDTNSILLVKEVNENLEYRLYFHGVADEPSKQRTSEIRK